MPRWPTGPFEMRRTGCYRCVRSSPSDGSCGIGTYPCMHPGVDLFATSPAVYAAANGKVVAVGGNDPPWVGYGPAIVMILADDGKFLLTAHLEPSSIIVKVGDRVAEGQRIADFYAPWGHTHFEVRHKITGPWQTNTMDPGAWIAGSSTIVNVALLAFVAWGGWKIYKGLR